MAQERPSTPEKQLLDLIEDPKEQDLSQKKVKRSSSSLFSLAALKGRFSFFIDGIRSGSFLKGDLWDIKRINKILKLCIAMLFLYIAASLIISAIKLKEVPEFVTRNPRPASDAYEALASGRNISDYLDGPRSRNIFQFGDFPKEAEVVEEEALLEEVAPPVETISQSETLAQNLDLVGIGWSDDPDVMINNTETGKMYFLKRGDRIDGLIKVEAIFEDKVIMTYDNGKELELR